MRGEGGDGWGWCGVTNLNDAGTANLCNSVKNVSWGVNSSNKPHVWVNVWYIFRTPWVILNAQKIRPNPTHDGPWKTRCTCTTYSVNGSIVNDQKRGEDTKKWGKVTYGSLLDFVSTNDITNNDGQILSANCWTDFNKTGSLVSTDFNLNISTESTTPREPISLTLEKNTRECAAWVRQGWTYQSRWKKPR